MTTRKVWIVIDAARLSLPTDRELRFDADGWVCGTKIIAENAAIYEELERPVIVEADIPCGGRHSVRSIPRRPRPRGRWRSGVSKRDKDTRLDALVEAARRVVAVATPVQGAEHTTLVPFDLIAALAQAVHKAEPFGCEP